MVNLQLNHSLSYSILVTVFFSSLKFYLVLFQVFYNTFRVLTWSRKWQHTPVFLPGKFHGQRTLVGYSPWGHKESDTTEHIYSFLGFFFTDIFKPTFHLSTASISILFSGSNDINISSLWEISFYWFSLLSHFLMHLVILCI